MATALAAPTAVYRSPAWAVALTSVAFFMVALDALVVITALPVIHRDLGASLSTLEWTVNAYTLAYAAGIITAAGLGDRFGRRRVFTTGLVLFSGASAACALAPAVGLLIAFRVMQGVGAAIIMPLSLTILTAAFPPERRGAIVGLWGGIGGLAVAAGPLVGGAITHGLDWHWIFWVNVPIGLLAAVLSIVRLAESRGPATRLDLPAVVLVSGGAVGLVWGLVRANDVGWGSQETIVALGLGILLLVGFVARERLVREPMLPLRLFRSRAFAAANATGFLMSAALTGAVFLAAQYFQFALGFSPLDTGVRILPWTATPILVAPAAGLLSGRIGQRPVMVVGMLLQGVGLAWLALVATTGVGYEQLVLPLLVAGIGVSMALVSTPTAVLSAVAPPDLGKASGANSTFQRFGSVFGIAVGAAVFAANGRLGTPASFDAGFRPALAVVAGLSLLGVMSALAVGGRRPLPAAVPAPVAARAAAVAPVAPAGSAGVGQATVATMGTQPAGTMGDLTRVALGLTLMTLARKAVAPAADPRLMAALSDAVDGRYPHAWSDEQRAQAVARDVIEPLARALLRSYAENRTGAPASSAAAGNNGNGSAADGAGASYPGAAIPTYPSGESWPMKRVRVTRRLMEGNRIVGEQALEAYVPLDAEAAAAALRVRLDAMDPTESPTVKLRSVYHGRGSLAP